MARPADWLDPMHKPATTAAAQNSGADVAAAAMRVIVIHPANVSARASL